MNLSEFGSVKYPIRASFIPKIFQCPLRAVLMFMKECEDSSGPAADTGSAVHEAIEQWYRNKFAVRDAVEAMRLSLPKFPLADMHDAEQQFLCYAADPRNARAKIIASEEEIRFTIGDDIHIWGHLDQVRDNDGKFQLYDVKTSKRHGLTIMREHALQQAAYCVGMTAKLGRTVHPGAIIMTRQYMRKGCDPRTSPVGVYFEYAYSYDCCKIMLDGLIDIVQLIRSGSMWANPGDYCEYCPAGGPDYCLPKFLKMVEG